MSNKMRKIRNKLDKINVEKGKLNILPMFGSTRHAKNGKWRETYVGSKEIEMVGRESEKEDMLNKVLQKDRDQESSIIPIIGLGGIGKTTLAKYIYNVKETSMFDVKAWVHVSMEFDLRKIIADIISLVEGSPQDKDTALQYLKSQLDRILCDKVYLIVLDDLWEESRGNLEKLMDILPSGKKGSKIIVTTRGEKVAAELVDIHSSFRIVEPIKLEGLSIDDCLSIMMPSSLGNEQLVDLIDIGKEIAKRCSGVPLVAKALGYVMQKQCTKEAWLEIRDCKILDIKGEDKGILKGLMLSYYQMPPQLKLCFMYCSIFPKSLDINRDCLIQQWIALGFIQDTEGQSLQKIGRECVEEFLAMSFFTISTSPLASATGTFKPTLELHMHDIVHDLARHIAGDEFSFLSAMAKRKGKRDNWYCHYHLLINLNEASSAYKAVSTKVRALHFRECDKMLLPKHAFSHTVCLRVLDLSGCHVSELPSTISKLKLLRYLDASNLHISELPKSLNQLLNLQTLILSNTSLETLPLNIGCLQKLQYFDLSRCANLHDLPTSFGNLSELLFLNLASCHELQTIPESFSSLHRLQFLNLSDCYKLHSLPESCCQLRGLTHLNLSDCHSLGNLPECIGDLSDLEYLNLTSCSKVQMLPDSLCKLLRLKHLNLSFCAKLAYLPSCIGDLQLESLNIHGCIRLCNLPDSIFNMSTLINIEAEFTPVPDTDVRKLKEHLKLQGYSELNGGSHDLWSQIVQLEKRHCDELTIYNLENAKCLEVSKQAKLSNNSKLKSLQLIWGHALYIPVGNVDATTNKSVLEKLMPPRSLQHLTLTNYMSIDFPSWFYDIASYIPYLTSVMLVDLERCNHLPPLGHLPNLRALRMISVPNIKSIGKEFYGDNGTCQKLRIIELMSMGNLEEWWTTRSSKEDGEFLIPNLHMLTVIDCPKLKFLPYPPRSMTWWLEKCDDVLPEHGFGSLSSITSPFSLHVVGTFQSKMWSRMHCLSSIKFLALISITGIRTLPDSIKCFTSLQVVHIVLCRDLETLPEWLGDFTSLRIILIDNSPKLSSLPERIQRLTNLEKLGILRSPMLSDRCQGEDRHKIAHIPEVIFGNESMPEELAMLLGGIA